MKKTQLIDSSCDFWLSWVSTEISEGRLTDLVIPEYVRIIGPRAFADCKNLVSVTFHSNLTAIGDEAFANCTALKSIEIPETLKILGNAPFIGCTSLSSVTIPGRFLEDFPIIFKGCTAVSSLVLASGSAVVFDGVGAVEPEIGLDLSGYPRLTTLEISERVTEINPQTLSKFSYLKTLKVSKTHKKYQSASRDKLLVEKATGKILYALSANISGDVLGIGPFAFIGVKSLESVFIPKGVIKIDPCAFNGCTELKSIVVSDDNPVYDSRDGSNAVIETSTSTLVVACSGTVLPKGVTDPQQYLMKFLDRSCETLVIPEGITYIDQETLCGFNTFTSIVIPSTVVEINPRVFNESIALEYIKVSPDNPVYDSREDCNAIIDTESNVMLVASMNTKVPAGVDIDPEGVLEYGIYNEAWNILYLDCLGMKYDGKGGLEFYGYADEETFCFLNRVQPSSVVFHGNIYGSFSEDYCGWCRHIKSIYIGKNVDHIGAGVFSWAYQLEKIVVSPENKVYDSREECNAIIETSTDTLVLGCIGTVVPEGIKKIGMFCSSDSVVTLPGSVKVIGAAAFCECENLSTIHLPDGLTTIGADAFYKCPLRDVIVPDSVTEIGDTAFFGLASELELPEKFKDDYLRICGSPEDLEEYFWDSLK